MDVPSHPTPASAECWQLWVRIGLLEHSSNWLALEVQWTSSRKMAPVPAPNWALLYASPAEEDKFVLLWTGFGTYYKHKRTSSVSISHLFTDHSSISNVPAVITHCPPLVIDAHLHSALILIGTSHQTNITICTVTSCYYCGKNAQSWLPGRSCSNVLWVSKQQ